MAYKFTSDHRLRRSSSTSAPLLSWQGFKKICSRGWEQLTALLQQQRLFKRLRLSRSLICIEMESAYGLAQKLRLKDSSLKARALMIFEW